MRPPASPGRVCRRRSRLVGPPGTRHGTGKRQVVRARLAASRSSGSASAARLRSTRSAPCRSFSLARSNASSGPAAALASSVNASWEAPASCLLAAASSARWARRSRVRRERRRSLEECGGRCESAPRAGALRGLLQFERDVLIGRGDRVRAMPGAAIGVEARDRWRLANARCAARRSSDGRRSVDRRAQERMAKRHLCAELQQAVCLGRRQLVDRNGDLLRGANEQRGLPRRISCRERAAAAGSRPAAAPTRRRKLASIRPGNDPSPGSSNPPANPSAENSRGSSSSASGLPRVSARIRARTRSSRGAAITDASSSRAAASASPPTAARAVRPTPPAGWARARRNRRTTDSAANRRATNASTCADDRSSHWTSSIRQTSGMLLRRVARAG